MIRAKIISKSNLESEVLVSQAEFDALKILKGCAYVNYKNIEQIYTPLEPAHVLDNETKVYKPKQYLSLKFDNYDKYNEWLERVSGTMNDEEELFRVESVISHRDYIVCTYSILVRIK